MLTLSEKCKIYYAKWYFYKICTGKKDFENIKMLIAIISRIIGDICFFILLLISCT